MKNFQILQDIEIIGKTAKNAEQNQAIFVQCMHEEIFIQYIKHHKCQISNMPLE